CRVPAPTWSPLLPRCFPATTGHAPRSSSGLSASSLNVPCDINVFIFDITMVNNSFTSAARILPFKTQVEHSQPSAPATNHPIEGEVAFCVRGVRGPPCGVPSTLGLINPFSITPDFYIFGSLAAVLSVKFFEKSHS